MKNRKMKVLVTGINGFVGKHLSQMLEHEGCEVFGIDTQGSGENVFPVDITDPGSVDRIVENIAPEFIFHLAGLSRVDLDNPRTIFNVNVIGTLNILSASVKLKNLPRILFVSSSQVYGTVDRSLQPMNEDTPVKPVNLYGASKSAAENVAMSFYNQFSLPSVIVRPFNHTGRGQTLNFVIPKLARAFREKDKELRLGNIDVHRDYLDVRDVAAAYITIMNDFRSGVIYNISSGTSIRLADSISLMQKISGHNPVIHHEKGLLRKNEIEYIAGDSSKIRRDLNWKPVFSFEDTLRWMLED